MPSESITDLRRNSNGIDLGNGPTPAKLTSLQIREMMENAQRQIEQRKKELEERRQDRQSAMSTNQALGINHLGIILKSVC